MMGKEDVRDGSSGSTSRKYWRGRWPVAGGSGESHLAANFRRRGVRCRQGRGGGSHGIGERATRIEAAAILFADLAGLRGNSLVSNGLSGLNDSGPQSIGSWFATAAYSYFAGRGERVTLRTRPACILSSIAVLNSGFELEK